MSRNIFQNSQGLSLIEIVVVLAVLGLMLAVVIPQFGESRENQVLKSAVGDILSNLSLARAQTLASLDSSAYGVHFESGKVIIFKGTSFVANDPGNQEVPILSPASITNVTLNGISGNSGEMYFKRLTGNPSKSGTVIVASPNFSRTITISATGAVSAD